MKLLNILFFICLLNACGTSEKLNNNNINKNKTIANKYTLTVQDQITKIEYVGVSRGVYKRVAITPQKITMQMQRTGEAKTKPITKNEWQQINGIATEIDIEALPELKPPSQKYQYDAAVATYLQIELGEKLYRTPNFDDNNPPNELIELINNLLDYTENSDN